MMPPSHDTTRTPQPRELASGSTRTLRTHRGPSAWDFIWTQMVEWTEHADGLLVSLMRSPDSRTVTRARRVVGRGRRLVEALQQLSTEASEHTEQIQEVQRVVMPHLRELDAVLWVVELDALGAPADGEPVTTWKAAAHVLGISEDTLFERRKAAGDRSRPWWPSGAATRSWFEGMKAACPPGQTRRRPRAQPSGAPIDWDRVKL